MNYLEKFNDIKTLLFDVDGVLTNSELIILESGKLLRKMSTRDGYALKKAIQAGYNIGIITGGKSMGVRHRLENLGIQDVFTGINDKMETYQNYIEQNNLKEEEILYMGDDMPDFSIMEQVGLPVCPSDAAPEIVNISLYVSPKKGGAGCVRDVIEKVMKIQQTW